MAEPELARRKATGSPSTATSRARYAEDPLGGYVVIREALANAAEHASGTNVTLRLSANEDQLAFLVGDGAHGFTRDEVQTAKQDHHPGQELLRPRVAEIGGRLRVESRYGRGTRVTATLPIHGVAS